MKRLTYFSIRSFTGPFLATFAISMFILVMQFFWKYIDDLMGKGIEITVIMELLFYVSASLIPLALPLAILLSSIMTMGNLSEYNELTALKSSGLSLYRIIRPLTGVAIIIAISTFFFANYIIPVANFKWHSIIYDIQNTKISTILTPGAYSNTLDGYAIKVDSGEDDHFTGILIHDHTDQKQIKTIRAEEGKIYRSEGGGHIFFELKNGSVMEELETQAPVYSDDGALHGTTKNTRPSRRSNFSQATYKIDLSGFDMADSQDDLFKDKHEMLNVFQINWAIDSINKSGRDILDNFMLGIKNDHPYLKAKVYQSNSKPTSGIVESANIAPDTVLFYDQLGKAQKIEAITVAQTKIRSKNENLKSQNSFLSSMERDIDSYLIEFHRKFALSCAIIVLFFVGAPLGAIVRKGGFGAPVVIAALLFMVYFVLITIGDKMAETNKISPFLGMWFATMVLLPIAIWLMRCAATDTPVFAFLRAPGKLFKRKA